MLSQEHAWIWPHPEEGLHGYEHQEAGVTGSHARGCHHTAPFSLGSSQTTSSCGATDYVLFTVTGGETACIH